MNNNFSPNILKTYKDCPKKYYFRYIENINIPQSSLPFEKGKRIHALANYYLRGVNIDRLETALNQGERQDWELLKTNEFYNKDYFKSEFPLSAKVGQYWVGGRIDAVVNEGENYYILDYKTGSTPKNAEYDYQTMVYLLCVDRYVKNYNSLYFVYINLKDKNNYIIPFSHDVREQYEEKIKNACKTISSDSIFKCNKNMCTSCEYAKICIKN